MDPIREAVGLRITGPKDQFFSFYLCMPSLSFYRYSENLRLCYNSGTLVVRQYNQTRRHDKANIIKGWLVM